MLWVLLAASSRTRGLQDELDELWPLFSLGGESVDGIGFPLGCLGSIRGNLSDSFFGEECGRAGFLQAVFVAWVNFVATVFFHRLCCTVSFR